MTKRMMRQGVFVLGTVVLAAGPLSSIDMRAQSAQAPAPSGNGQAQANRPQLPVTMQQAVDMALEFNLGLKSDRLDPQVAAEALSGARAYYNPLAFSNARLYNGTTAPTSFLDSGATNVTTKQNSLNVGVRQNLPWYGGFYQASVSGGRTENSQLGNPFNPQLSSSLNFQFNQPLLRNLKTDQARTAVKTTQILQQITDTTLQDNVARTARTARLQYLTLVGAIEGRKVAQQNLDVARESLRGNRARVDVGMMAPADIVDGEAAVSNAEEQLIIVDGQIESAMDQLRRTIMDPARPDYWTVKIVPTEAIEAAPRTIDIDAAVKTALENRSDLVIIRKQLESTRATLDLLHNQTLPNVDLSINYVGSGTAGTQFKYDNQDYANPTSTSSKGFGSAIGDAFGYVQPQWTYQVSVGYPLGRSDAKAGYARQQILQRKSEIDLRDAEQSVATEVRDAARNVETTFRRVQAARTSLAAQEKRYEQEQKRFDVGLSQTFTLFTVQGEVARARVNELQARLQYTQALIAFEAVQHIR